MERSWRYLIPSILTALYLILCIYAHYYYLYPLLLVGNLLNIYWGEFKNTELSDELRFFYRSKTSYYLKCVNAVVLLGLIIWGTFFVDKANFSWGHLLGFSVTTGLLTGCFIVTLAHDLLHSKSKLQKTLSVLLLTVSGIPHFATEHVFGHHRYIGLKEDATTAKLNEDFYTYFFKVTFSNLKESFLTQYGLPGYLRRRVLFANLKMLGLLAMTWILIFFFAQNPVAAIVFFMLQGFVSYVLYELINYIQHYGLHRRDKREEISQQLSWNCYYKYTNYLLFLLPLHSLHHLPDKSRRTTNLKAGPRMPYLYFMMIAMALLPPIWFYKMNRLAMRYNPTQS
ncbi:fatty acid desaturase [Persicitalea sp.]|uniref:fatty acid desaturase n=1 Tax=Persicitalea sp. TaxID=3100273 RepID=UPI00359485FB